MKKTIFVIVFATLYIACILLWVSTSNNDNAFVTKLAEITGVKSKNLFVNADFKEGFKGWETDDNIQIVESNGTKCVCLKGRSDRVKIYQRVNVISGKKYRLTFNLSGSEDKAAAIYYDYKLKKYHFKGFNEVSSNSKYIWEIIPDFTTNTPFYFSIKGEGVCTYSNISLRTTNDDLKERISYYALRFLILLLVLPILFLLIRKYTNVFFVIIVLLMQILPISKISQEEKSEVENRNLAKYKSLVEKDKKGRKDKINIYYGIDFNSWLNDHFRFREYILSNFSYWKMVVNNRFENEFVLSGKNNFYFRKGNIKPIINHRNISENEYIETKKSIERFYDFCYKNDIDLYILIIPRAPEVYKEELNGVNFDNYAGFYSNHINKINQELKVNVLYAFDILNNSKNQGLVYFKTDHHWSYFGGYLGYRLVINEMIKKYPDLNSKSENDYIITCEEMRLGWGSIFGQLNLARKNYKKAYPYDTKYIRYKYKNENSISGIWKDTDSDKSWVIIRNNSGYNKKIFLFGDSYIRYYYPYFTHTFSETCCYLKKMQINMPEIEKVIIKYQPDIVILNVYAENLRFIQNWYK